MNERHMEALEQYGLKVTEIRRGRGAWICETEQGIKLLREYKGTAKRLEFEDYVLSCLEKRDGVQVDYYVRNQEGELWSAAGDGTRYILKDWYLDRECNIRDNQEILHAVSKIALLHKQMRKVPFQESWSLGSIQGESPVREMERHNRELIRTRNFIRKKRKKTEFELCIIGNYQMFYEQALEAQGGMADMLKAEQAEPLFLCHGELNQHHILMGNRQTAIVEFNKMHIGIQIRDLYHFMRKVMEKHNWSLYLGMSMLENYDRVLPITDWERQHLYLLFLYPEKYWKQLNFYFNANKAWIPDKNVEKLKNLEAQQESRNRFLSKIK